MSTDSMDFCKKSKGSKNGLRECFHAPAQPMAQSEALEMMIVYLIRLPFRPQEAVVIGIGYKVRATSSTSDFENCDQLFWGRQNLKNFATSNIQRFDVVAGDSLEPIRSLPLHE
jgi:hypothetical protein